MKCGEYWKSKDEDLLVQITRFEDFHYRDMGSGVWFSWFDEHELNQIKEDWLPVEEFKTKFVKAEDE